METRARTATQEQERRQVPSRVTKAPAGGVFLAVMGVLFVALSNLAVITTNDTWWHLKMGEWMVAQKALYTSEVFSATTAGDSYVAYEWLSQIIFYLIADSQGITLSLFVMLFSTTCAGLLWVRFLKNYSDGKLTYLLLLLLSFTITFRCEARPQIFGLWLAALLIFCCFEFKDSGDLKILVPCLVLQPIWANLHGSFMLGPALALFFSGAALAGVLLNREQAKDSVDAGRWKVFLGFGVALLLLSLLNPFGYKLLAKSISMYFSNSYMRDSIQEWRSIIDPDIRWGAWFYTWLMLMVSTIFFVLKDLKKMQTFELCVIALALYFPFSGIRYVPHSALLIAPVLFKYAFLYSSSGARPWRLGALTAPCLVLFALVGYPISHVHVIKTGLGFDYDAVPTEIITHLKAHDYRGNILNPYNEGAFLIYYLHPEINVTMDSRTELYGPALKQEHELAFTSPEKLGTFIQKHDVKFIMAPNWDVNLRDFLIKVPNWHLEKAGPRYNLFVRSDVSVSRERVLSSGHGSPVVSEQERACIYLRLMGRCFDETRCAKECAYTDDQIGELLGLERTMCLKFAQACFNRDHRCGPCKRLCDTFASVESEINALGNGLRAIVTCDAPQ